MAEKKPKRTAKKIYKMPEKLTKGEVITDIKKVSWIIGNSIGIGGFGEIYMAAKTTEPTKFAYAVKIEPSENGPLFCERTVYVNISKQEDIDEFKQLRGLKSIGIPGFYGFGQHKFKDVDYRFIVIEKLGKDLNSFFNKDKRLPYPTVLKIGIQILHVLEYMHSKSYVHCDVKAGNLLLGDTKGKQNQVYVVDFGLACKYATVYKPNPKKAHDGTAEYTSRDAHAGVMTRRGDLEVLAYNLLHWATGRLPWEKLTNCQEIQAKKESFMKSTDKLMAACYKTETPHTAVEAFITKICNMAPLDDPDYDKFTEILKNDLKKFKTSSEVLEFGDNEETKSPVKKVRKKVETKLSGMKKFSSSSEVLDFDEDEGIKTPVKKSRKKVVETEADEVSKPKRRRRVLSETDTNEIDVPAVRKSPRKKQPVEEKRSWRDCPTVVNGGGIMGPKVETPKKKGSKNL